MKRVCFPVRMKRGSSVVSIYKTPTRASWTSARPRGFPGRRSTGISRQAELDGIKA